MRSTNQANEGVDDRKAVKGKVVFEREFPADFALDLPWHHYPAVTSLTEEDKQKIAALLKTRAGWFKPDFAALYKRAGGKRIAQGGRRAKGAMH